MRKLTNLEPERVLYYFEELTQIPRCSKKEQQVSDYLAEFGKKLGLETIQDDALNVIIKKPGTKGYEDHDPVIIQGHMDMVCENSETCDINFDEDPIPFEVDGDYIVAKETTLGADNGIAVAMGMALLEADDVAHPPIEFLATADEETGMTGAEALDFDMLDGKILLNIDTEEEGTAIAGCAGGERIHLRIPYEKNKSEYDTAVEILVTGLKGGHSGSDIHLGRGNANVILARWLDMLRQEMSFDLIHIHGGGMHNAIPRLAKAKIAFHQESLAVLEDIKNAFQKTLSEELVETDGDVTLEIERLNEVEEVFNDECKDAVIDAILLTPIGVQAMNQSLPDLVESSNNLGVVRTEADHVSVSSAPRSSTMTLKELTARRIVAIGDLIEGAEVERTAGYPAWKYKKESKIQDAIKEAYEELTGEDLKVEVIHAGLECGLFAERNPELDMISFGPNIYGAHAPGERVSISSVKNIWDLLVHLLAKL